MFSFFRYPVRRLRISFAWLSIFSMLFYSMGGVFFVQAAVAEEGDVSPAEVVEEASEPVASEEPPAEEQLSVEPTEPLEEKEPPTVTAIIAEVVTTPVEEPPPVEEPVSEEPAAEGGSMTEPVEPAEPTEPAEPLLDLNDTTEAESSAQRAYVVDTDKDDYAPWETVVITGEGYDPGHELEIRVTWPDGVVRNSAGDVGQTNTTTADEEGRLSFLYDLRGDGQEGEYLLEVLSGGAALVSSIFSDTQPKITICHIAGREGSDHAITLELSYAAVYGPGGHFNESGTPLAGHEQDYFGACVPVCGNGIVEEISEECDDGNLTDGDGCSSTCTSETLPTLYPTPTPIEKECPNDFIAVDTLDKVDLGDATSEGDHDADGWGADPGGGNYGRRDGGDFALVVVPDECTSKGTKASVVLTVPADHYADEIQIRHLDGLSNYDSFSLYINDALYAHYTDVQDSSEVWDTQTFPLPNLTGDVKVELEVTDPIWASCATWGQLAVNWISVSGYYCPGCGDDVWGPDEQCDGQDGCTDQCVWEEVPGDQLACEEPEYAQSALDRVNIGDAADEAGHNLTDWGPVEPVTSGGNWGGACEDETCRVVYAPDEGVENRGAAFEMDFGTGDYKELRLRVLDGISMRDSFEVYVDGDLLYRWVDNPVVAHSEIWKTHVIDTSGYTGTQTVRVVSLDHEWSSFAVYGQVGLTWAEVWEYECPEDCVVQEPGWADRVVNHFQGTGVTDPNRMDSTKVLGLDDGAFYSLGMNGWLVLSFDGYVINTEGDDLSFHEVTYGRDSYGIEKMGVEVSQNGSDWVYLGTVTNKDGGDGVGYLDLESVGLAWVRYVRLTDTTEWLGGDGYDLDAVDVTLEGCKEPKELDFEPGSMDVWKYEDLDGVLGRSGDEAWIGDPTFTFRVYKVTLGGWVFQGQEDTNSEGKAEFVDIFDEVGEYKVCEVRKPGWEDMRSLFNPANNQSGAEDEYPTCEGIIVSEPDYFVSPEFGNIRLGKVVVTKFEDINNDGLYQEGSEPVLDGWDVRLGSETKTTIAGQAVFDGLIGGDYGLMETSISEDWVLTNIYCDNADFWIDASNQHEVSFSNGEEVDCYIGNFRLGELIVCKIDDLDGDGKDDEGEPGLNGVTMTLEKREKVLGDLMMFSQSLLDVEEDPYTWQQVGQADTAERGCVTFSGLLPGYYRVSEDLDDLPGYMPTSPTTVEFDILTSGESETVEFFNHLSSVSLSLEKSNTVSGSDVTYMLKVKNTGETTAYDVKVKDSLPFGFTYQVGSTVGAGEPVVDGQQLTWSVGDLAPEAEAEFRYMAVIGDVPSGVYPNIAVAWGQNRPDAALERAFLLSAESIGGDVEPELFYSNVAYSGVRISHGVSTTTVLTGQVLGASTGLVLGAATGNPTGWLVLAFLLVGVGLMFKLITVKKGWQMALVKKVKKIAPFLTLLVSLFVARPAWAVDGLYIQVSEFPEYVPADNLKLYYNTLEVMDRPVEVTCWVRKDGGFGWRTFGGTQTDPVGSCEVFGHELDGDGKYFFYAEAKSSEGTSSSNETSTIVDRSAPGNPEEYAKSRQANTIYKIEWRSPDNSDFAYVRIFASKTRDFVADDATKVADVGSAPDTKMSHLVTGLEPDVEYYFALQSFDKAGNASSLTGDGASITYVALSSGEVAGQKTEYIESTGTGGPGSESGFGDILGDEDAESTGSDGSASWLDDLEDQEETTGARYWIWFVVGGGIILLMGYLFFREDGGK